MHGSAAATFADQPPIEQSPGSMSVSGPGEKVIRLPAYSKRALSIKLAESGSFDVKAQSLFPNLDCPPGVTRLFPRFAIKIVKGGHPVYQRRYSAHQTSLAEALANALRWISNRRRQERWSYVCSWPLLFLWMFSIAVGWIFKPIVG
jgi:hypothetical protein